MYNKGVNKWQKPLTKLRTIQLPLLITIIALMFVIVILGIDRKKPTSQFTVVNQIKNNLDESMVQFNPTVDFLNGTDIIWQIPNSPKSVLFLAHGCSGRAANFWDKSPNCAHCIGLPEERLIVLKALARKFAVITVSSRGKCWSLGKETLVVEGIIKWWVEKENLEKLPLVALGASSGGYFVSMLASKMKFSSIALMIAEGVFDRIDDTKNYPPTIFVHMPKDKLRKKAIDVNLEVLRSEGIDVAAVECMELPLSPNFLADRIPGLDLKISVELFNLFKEREFVNEEGYLVNDGRVIPWKAAMNEKKIQLPDKLLVKYIHEELNLAFAYHEMTSLQSDQIFDWFESHFR
ncbi:uncharacterized protein LOC112524183 [Cynara cardunculus var. scolymus]|uniref:Uncharacterized protein n=1 Tax=Cynara cardunculus var. scolymus TaxID=59895 RepID=A0A118K312_CYNCS|nr:uncharacterized protein LOC112524183 [Cynara cardunculus var. scolymus]KVI05235.1 hypothetical protein Ccrd_016427 [Cynara cardunculus var. scolymus]